jgi:hypothetical protein
MENAIMKLSSDITLPQNHVLTSPLVSWQLLAINLSHCLESKAKNHSSKTFKLKKKPSKELQEK